MKRASLIVSFWAVSILIFVVIDARANPYTGGIAPFGATQYGGDLQYGAAEVPLYDVAGGQIMMASYTVPGY